MFFSRPQIFYFGLLVVFVVQCDTVIGNEVNIPATNVAERTFYVAPKKVSDGKGTSQATAADLRDMNFWAIVRQAVQERPVVVFFWAVSTSSVPKRKRRYPP